MDKQTLQALLATLAEQQYQSYLLATLLVEKGILKSGEIAARHDPSEKSQFDRDFYRYLATIGLGTE